MKKSTDRFSISYFHLRRSHFGVLKYFPVYILLVTSFLYFHGLQFPKKVERELPRNSIARQLSIHSIKTRSIINPNSDLPCMLNNPNLGDKTFQVRKKVQRENRDEFLDEVLRQIGFSEVALSCIRMKDDPENDRSIQMDIDRIVKGLSENGSASTISSEKKEEAKRVFKVEYLNRLLSDHISFNRSLPDFREPECQITYDLNHLPSFSVVMVFLNEPFSILMRSLHSIFNRTPKKLLKELILVDDYSDQPHLHSKLTRYLATRFPVEKIRLVRLSRRSGLIRARMIGAHLAVGDVLIFLDAHIEVTDNWSEPLLKRISEDRTVVASPVVDNISRTDFEYQYNRTFEVGTFSWAMFHNWLPVQAQEEKRKPTYYSPTRTPTIIGGLFAMERKYFWEMGSYDPGMLIWGGENIEMSFRIWQCGGSLEVIPCSRIGHVYRHARPNSVPSGMPQNTYALNTARLAEVWMDQYKELYYFTAPRINTFGHKWTNVSRRKAFRSKKKCKSFQWYLDTVHPEKFRMKFHSKLYGQFENKGAKMCLDRNVQSELEFLLEVYICYDRLYSSQTFYLTIKDELRLERECATALKNNRVKMVKCANRPENDAWEYTSRKALKHKRTNKCMAMRINPQNKSDWITVLEDCKNNDVFQRWGNKMENDFYFYK